MRQDIKQERTVFEGEGGVVKMVRGGYQCGGNVLLGSGISGGIGSTKFWIGYLNSFGRNGEQG